MQESAGCRLKIQGSRPVVGSVGLGGSPKSALERLKERIIFIVGYFFLDPLFWVSFCFKLYLSTLEFWEGDVKIAIFRARLFHLMFSLGLRSLWNVMVASHAGRPLSPPCSPLPAPARASWAATSGLSGLAEGTPWAFLLLVGLGGQSQILPLDCPSG